MNILHTSDWHLGKRLMDRDRLPEQKKVLDEIVRICEERDVSLILVAGDVFDAYMPSAESEELFFSAMKQLAGENRAVVAISGNHDDGIRLSSSAPIAEEHGIYLFGGEKRTFSLNSHRKVRAVEAGECYLVIENERGERVYINAFPYPNEARLKEEKSDLSYAEKIAHWIERGEIGYHGDIPHILLSHLFVAGGKTSESERDIDLGGARVVPLSVLPDYGYVALGHLHKPQKLRHARYSGSILQYSFDEAADKRVLLLRSEGTEITVAEEIPLQSGKRLVRLECNGVEEALAILPDYPDCFVELTLHLKQPLSTQETVSLRAANEGLVSLVTRVEGGTNVIIERRSALSSGQLFTEYYKSVYGDEPKDALKEAFLRLLEEE